jgi:hypothetical protein
MQQFVAIESCEHINYLLCSQVFIDWYIGNLDKLPVLVVKHCKLAGELLLVFVE